MGRGFTIVLPYSLLPPNSPTKAAPAEQAAIFDKFVRGQGVTEQAIPGTGLGLALVKSLVQHLDGTIEVQSQGAAGDHAAETQFTLTLPPPPSFA
ncbi:MAG: hypothetical protein HC838_07430 [Spirulinaceae cyanobacterium RM2_2_10]|nr:hypothetical protein [Spirulinaceae cyanobacterium RM2_2_10]